VQKAQVLAAADILTTGLNSRSKDTQRVRNIEKLRTCFTVRENQVAVATEKIFYLIITKPDKNVLANKAGESFATQDGDLVYTAKRAIEYENKDIEVCIFSDTNGRLAAGNYEVKLYCDGYMTGTSTFTLK
jgi:hypothetical protein